MTHYSRFNRLVFVATFFLVLIHMFWAHHEQQRILSALTEHQGHSIAAFAQINSTIANGILQKIQAQQQRDEDFKEQGLDIESEPQVTPTPRVITKTRTRLKIIRPTPKPFRLFGPN